MIQLFIAIILLIFFGLFAMMALPMKEEVNKLDQKPKRSTQQSRIQDN